MFVHFVNSFLLCIGIYLYYQIKKGTPLRAQGKKDMYEVVKIVKGYKITRMIGTKGAYHVNVREGKGFKEFHTFKTIKAATEFIEKTL